MKRVILVCLILSGCGDGARSYTDNFTNINCNTNVFTETEYAEVVQPEEVEEAMDELEELGAENLKQSELDNGDVLITYTIEQCNGNGNISGDDRHDINDNN